MSTFKKAVALLLVIAITAAIAVTGTLAYLKSEDSDVNVMTLGNVKIEQIEQQRNGNGGYEGFEQGQGLYPVPEAPAKYIDLKGNVISGSDDAYKFLADSEGKSLPNALDKIVTVKNTGKSAAYVRTIFAFEIVNSVDEVKTAGTHIGLFRNDGANNGTNGNTDWYWTWLDEAVTIKDQKYAVVVALHKDLLDPKDETIPSLTQVYLKSNADNDYVAELGDTYDILVLSQAIQTEGFADAETALDTGFGEFNEENVKIWFGATELPTFVYNVVELQNAIDNAKNGDTIILGEDIKGNVTVTQKEGIKFTINGNGNTIDGSITVDGKSKRYETAGITIQNVKFASDNAAPGAYINLGVSGNTNTRYTNNVTVSNCTFDYSGTGDKVGIKSYTGGDWNLTVEGCTAMAKMHSLVQVSNVEKGLTITNCKAYSKNGINLNYTPYLNMSGCVFDTTGYCVRFGVNGYTNNGNFTIADSTLTSKNEVNDGVKDAVIILRGDMTGATLNIKGTTLTGEPQIANASNATIKIVQ